MGVGFHALHRKATELLADHLKLVVEPRGADGHGSRLRAHQLNQPRPRGLRIAALGQGHHRGDHHHPLVVLGEAHVLGAQDLGLAHGQAAIELPEVLPEGDLEDELLGLAKGPGLVEPRGPALHLPEGFHIGCDPGEPVGRGLIPFDRGSRNLAVCREALPDHVGCARQEPFGGRHGLRGELEEIWKDHRCLVVRGLTVMGHGTRLTFSATAKDLVQTQRRRKMISLLQHHLNNHCASDSSCTGWQLR